MLISVGSADMFNTIEIQNFFRYVVCLLLECDNVLILLLLLFYEMCTLKI
jgi:hypothetical protein